MVISLDNLAHRYGMLPSEALQRGTTFDFRVMEVSAKWETRKRRLEEEPEVVKAEDHTREMGQDALQAILDSTGDENANTKEQNRPESTKDTK